jgi:omega-hydroxy-beta-dihydromenaquinone-9 sulfotransferase
MMSRILGNHPNVFSFQELHYFDEIMPPAKAEQEIAADQAIKQYATLLAIQRNGYFGSRKTDEFVSEATEQVKQAGALTHIGLLELFLKHEAARNGKSIPCEQTPQTIFAAADILKHLEGSKVIVMVRDPRAVLFSQKYKWKRRSLSGGKIPFWEMVRSRVNYHPITISKIWRSVMTEANKISEHPNVLLVRYEDLIAHPEVTIKHVCAFAGIEFVKEMTDIPVVGSSAASDNPSQRGIDSTKKEQWQNGGLSNAEISLCQEINSTLMQQFGYDIKNVKASPVAVSALRILFPFRLALAAMFNLKRLKDPVRVLRKFR